MKPQIENAPGIVIRKKADGRWSATWRARDDLIDKGFSPKNVPLWSGAEPSAVDVAYIQDQCQRLQAEMLAFSRGVVAPAPSFDGTLKTLIQCYQTDPDSTYHKKRYQVRKQQDFFLKRITKTHGHERLTDIRTRVLLAWHKQWSNNGVKITVAHALIAHLRTLFGFGSTLLEDPECERLRGILHVRKFPQGQPREVWLTSDQVVAIRKSACDRWRFSIAMAQAFQFDLMLRQKDVIGEYVPLSEPGISDTINTATRQKWIMGLRWEEIDENFVLRHKTSKRGKDIQVNLKLAPMVMEELGTDDRSLLPASGPVIVSETTGLPYSADDFSRKWREIATEAGVPKAVKNMDSRAGGITEATDAGADLEHIRHAATHSDIGMTQRYSRGNVEKVEKVMAQRLEFRNKKPTT